MMTRLGEKQKIDAFETVVQLLHNVFPTKAMAQTKGFHEVRELGDRFYPHVLAMLNRFEQQHMEIRLSPELYSLIENLFWQGIPFLNCFWIKLFG